MARKKPGAKQSGTKGRGIFRRQPRPIGAKPTAKAKKIAGAADFGYSIHDQHRKLRDAFTASSDEFIDDGATDKFPESMKARLARLDEHVQQNPGQPISHFVRTLMPEVAAIEMRQEAAKQPSKPLPKVPPALWEKDRRPDDTPMTFFMRNYEPWIGQIYAGEYRRLDPKGYNALWHYLKNPENPRPSNFSLPTRHDANKRWIAQVESTGELTPLNREGPADYRDLERLAAALRRRSGKQSGR